MPAKVPRINAFNLRPGRIIGGKYLVESRLGSGWEGEVYKVVERRIGIHRAAKLFFPHRNVHDRAVTFYAKKLERLSKCSIVIQYHHSEVLRHRDLPITCLISEYVDGILLHDFVARFRGGRMPAFEALHLIYALARGLEDVHNLREYHGDLHDGNVMVRRRGIFFEVKIVDFFHWGRPTPTHFREDVQNLARLLYDAVGGRAHYRRQPAEIKAICRGLRNDLIGRAFPTARHLREFLETFVWRS